MLTLHIIANSTLYRKPNIEQLKPRKKMVVNTGQNNDLKTLHRKLKIKQRKPH